MILKWVSIVIVLLAYNHFNIIFSNYDIQIDFNLQFDVLIHNHKVSSKVPTHKLHSWISKRLISNYGISPRYKLHKAKSRSLAGPKKWRNNTRKRIVEGTEMWFYIVDDMNETSMHDWFNSKTIWYIILISLFRKRIIDCIYDLWLCIKSHFSSFKELAKIIQCVQQKIQ